MAWETGLFGGFAVLCCVQKKKKKKGLLHVDYLESLFKMAVGPHLHIALCDRQVPFF